MRSAVIRFPGSNCDRDMATAIKRVTGQAPIFVWHKDSDFPEVDLIALPGGFSYGDYLRAGAIAAHSPIMKELVKRANDGVSVLGVCNGFQVLTECGLLPGTLMRNKGLDFICDDVRVEVCNTQSRFTKDYPANTTAVLPVAHMLGNFYADQVTINQLEQNEQVLFRYAGDINGAQNRIAGITNKRGNILGMMPHPERAADPDTGLTDGTLLFTSLLNFFN